MSKTAQQMTELISNVISHASKSDRNEWSGAKKIGVSDVGGCHEYVRRMILNEDWSDEQLRYEAASLIGTLIGDALEQAAIDMVGDGTAQDEVEVHLPLSEEYQLTLVGHPDLYWPADLIDFKTKDGLGVVRREGFPTKNRWQLSLYAKGLIDAGKLNPGATLHLIGVDRSGAEREPFVESWTYDPQDVEDAKAWFLEVIDAIRAGEESSRDMPREWCFNCCPYATACRGDDTDAEGLIVDQEMLQAVESILEARQMEKLARDLKSSATSILRSAGGRTETHTVRWVHVNAIETKPSKRAAYDRLDIKPVRKGK